MLLACPPISLLFACFVHVLVLAPQLLHAFGLPTHLLALSMLLACPPISLLFLPVMVLALQLLHAFCLYLSCILNRCMQHVKVGLLFATYKLQSIWFHNSQQLTLS